MSQNLPPQDLRSFSQVCSRVNAVLIPLTYRTVTFRAASEWALNVLDIDAFFSNQPHLQLSSYLQHTRQLSIQAQIHIARFNRCAHYSIFRTSGLTQTPSTLGTSDEAKAHRQFLNDISDQIQRVFACLEEDSLLSFQWGLGTCLSPGILDKNGYLCRHQRSLNRLSLITDGSCPDAGDALDGLSEFSSLKIIEWEGIRQPAEVDSLQRCIRRNSSHLTILSIGLVSSSNAQNLVENIFEQHSGLSHSSALPSLLSLTLCKAPFPETLQLGSTWSCRSLRALSIRDCPNQLRFLNFLSHSKDTLQLKLFEFVCDNLLDGLGQDVSPALKFLVSFRGLRHLYLKLSNFEEPPRIDSVIKHHQDTLESLSYHERRLVPLDDEGLFEEERDVSPQWLEAQFDSLNLSSMTALGLCAGPSAVRIYLEPLATRSAIQILHIRFTGSERLHRDIPLEITSRLRTKLSRDKCHHYNTGSSRQQLCTSSWSDLSSIVNDDLAIWEMNESGSVGNPLPASSEAEEFVAFAEWVFGPTGLPNLEVLAFGDFSHNDRFQKQQFLTRRRHHENEQRYKDHQRPACIHEPLSQYFCAASSADTSLWEKLRVDGARFLSSCPTSGLIESPFEF
ncbi:uncharacterized protein N7511_004321 [Penicillium nucicola]|uniref:uncharacterized protein n=1 Tax=Penicillium nucicola TaxID=1850975 RepID=UPI0025454A14|nr:uncharacterized protein N7511_004321 [Penicillium nucicola]KAJ5766705.1 hypothetical protein N7511_004321 [Penicillium nucicola]